MHRMPTTVRGVSLSLTLCALTLGGCLDRGGLDPLPDAGSDDDGGSGGATGGSGTGGAHSGGTSGTGGGAQTGGAPGTGGLAASGGTKASGGATVTGGRMGSSGGATASGGAGGVKGTGGVTGTGGGGTGGKKTCSAICDIFCPYGNILDADGCPTCKCNPTPMCPQIKCMDNCPNGYLKDEKGCQTCMCNPDNTCTAAECGTMPPANTIVCPAGTKAPAADTSGAAAPIVAPYVCTRDASGKCVWQSRTCQVVCPAIGCANMCPNGYEVGADGCQTCTCQPAPASVCGTYTSAAACAADASCRWLQPGCTEPALAAAGCFAKTALGCTSDASCGAGHQCLKRMINPCAAPTLAGGTACTACALAETICQ